MSCVRLTVNGGEPVRLARAGGSEVVAIRIAQQYRIVQAEDERGPLKVQTTAYMYTLEDADSREIFGYHWHPGSRFSFPHLHLEAGAKLGRAELQRAHFPTGRISVEEFLRLVIEAFDVRIRRKDWRSVLQQAHAAFLKWRTWARAWPFLQRRGGGSPPRSPPKSPCRIDCGIGAAALQRLRVLETNGDWDAYWAARRRELARLAA